MRATGSPAYVAALEPLPDAPDEEAVYRALGVPWCPPELREEPFRGEPPALVEPRRHPRRPALPHDLVGRAGERRGDGARRPRARLRVPRDLRPHARGGRRPRAHRRRRAPPGRGDRRRERAARAVPRPARDRVRHPPRRAARPARRRARRARLGPGERARRAANAAAGADEARRGGAAQPLRALPQPPEGPATSTGARRTRSTSSACSRSRSRRASRSRSTACPTASTSAASTSATRCGRRADRLLDGLALGARAREHGPLGHDGAARLGDGRGRRQRANRYGRSSMAPISAERGGHDWDWIVIGSGFGGSVAALRLAEKGYSVCVNETAGGSPTTSSRARPGTCASSSGCRGSGCRGILRLTPFKDVAILSRRRRRRRQPRCTPTRSTARRARFFEDPQWAGLARLGGGARAPLRHRRADARRWRR